MGCWMMKKLIFIVLLVLVLQACNRNQNDYLGIPSNIRFEDEYVVWDAVDDAEYYTVRINDVDYRADDARYSMYNFVNGTYQVRVRSHREDEQSIFSNALTFQIDRIYEHPKNVYVVNDILYWDAISEASSYRVYINDLTFDVSSGTTFNLDGLDENTLYEIQVLAIYDKGESNLSSTVIYHSYHTLIDTIRLEANKNRSTPKRFPVETMYYFEHAFIESTRIEHHLIEFTDDSLLISHTLLQDLEEKEYTIQLLTPEGRVEIMLNVLDEQKPYMTSSNTVTYQGDSLSFEFELFGGSFGKLSGLNITTDDYHFDGNTLTISSDFIDSIIADEPERTTIILSYDLSLDDLTVIGFVFIYLD